MYNDFLREENINTHATSNVPEETINTHGTSNVPEETINTHATSNVQEETINTNVTYSVPDKFVNVSTLNKSASESTCESKFPNKPEIIITPFEQVKSRVENVNRKDIFRLSSGDRPYYLQGIMAYHLNDHGISIGRCLRKYLINTTPPILIIDHTVTYLNNQYEKVTDNKYQFVTKYAFYLIERIKQLDATSPLIEILNHLIENKNLQLNASNIDNIMAITYL